MELALEGVLYCIVNLWAIPSVEEWGYGEVIACIVSVFIIASNLFLIPVLAYVFYKNRNKLDDLEDYLGEFSEYQKTFQSS